MLVAGYYVFTFAVRLSVRLSVHSTYIHPSALPFRSITSVFIHRFHSNFANAFVPTMSRSGLLMGKFRSFITEFWHLSMYKKWFLASCSFTIWSIMMKLHRNDPSSKISILASKFCHFRLSTLALELYTCTKS